MVLILHSASAAAASRGAALLLDLSSEETRLLLPEPVAPKTHTTGAVSMVKNKFDDRFEKTLKSLHRLDPVSLQSTLLMMAYYIGDILHR